MKNQHASTVISRTLVLLTGVVITGFVMTGCESLQRSSTSGYRSDRDLASDDRSNSTVSEGDDSEGASDLRVRLHRAEEALEGKREREQYFRHKPYMRGDHERLQFLALDSFDDRQRWLNARGISPNNTVHSPQVQLLIEDNDIALGMTKAAVKESWGEPELVEVAGNPMYGNERWGYTEQKSSTEGYHGEKRMVYFESGRVVGWETH